jgi:tripartite ATP-independent transporter DctP family solute receptor
MVKRVFLAAIVILVISVSALLAGGQEEEKIVLRVGHTNSPEQTAHKYLILWSDLVKERSDGQIDIQVFPSEQLGNERTLPENVNLGSVDGSMTGAGVLSRWYEPMGIFEAPFVFKDMDHFKKVITDDDLTEQLATEIEKVSNIHLVGLDLSGVRQLMTRNKPIRTPADGKGLKIRVPDVPTFRVAAEAMGGIPTPLAYGEVYLALKQGVVDAVENPVEGLYKMKFFEVCKYLNLTNHMIQAGAVIINKDVWHSLSSRQQKILKDAYKEAAEFRYKTTVEEVDKYVSELKAAGIEVIEPPSLQPFMDRAATLLEVDFIPKWGIVWDEVKKLAD